MNRSHHSWDLGSTTIILVWLCIVGAQASSLFLPLSLYHGCNTVSNDVLYLLYIVGNSAARVPLLRLYISIDYIWHPTTLTWQVVSERKYKIWEWKVSLTVSDRPGPLFRGVALLTVCSVRKRCLLLFSLSVASVFKQHMSYERLESQSNTPKCPWYSNVTNVTFSGISHTCQASNIPIEFWHLSHLSYAPFRTVWTEAC